MRVLIFNFLSDGNLGTSQWCFFNFGLFFIIFIIFAPRAAIVG